MTERSSNALSLAASKAKEIPNLMGWYLARYQDRHGYSIEDLMSFLGGDSNCFPRLALCSRPDDTRFRHDIEAISNYSGVDAAKLAQLVREVIAFESLSSFIPSQEHEIGRYLAARDKEEDDESDDNPNEKEKK